MKIKGLRWWIIGLIGVSTIINYIDRSAINIMWPYVYKDFGIADADSKQVLAYITSFFMIAYALGQTLTGKMMDQIGTRLGMSVSIIGWSISIAFHALAKGVMSFSIFRFFLGLSEAGNWPGATKSNAEWFPARQRGIAQGIFGASASLGSVIAAPFIAALYLAFGWRATFIVIGGLGIIWLIPWLVINKATPDKHPWITPEEQSLINDKKDGEENQSEIIYSWKQLLQFKNTWGILTARLFIDPVWWLFVTWLPTFLKEQFGFDIKQVGAFAWVPYLFAAIGGLLGGYYASYKINRGMDSAKARKQAITIGSVIMLVSLGLFALYLEELKMHISFAIGLISATLFGFQFLIGNIQTLPSDYFSGKNIGTVSGMSGTAAVAGTLITTLLVPFITQVSYLSFFVLASILVPISWLCIIFISSKKPPIMANKIISGVILFMFLFKTNDSFSQVIPATKIIQYANQQARLTVAENAPKASMPVLIDKGKTQWTNNDVYNWRSGFWPGIEWYLFEATKDNYWREQAAQSTNALTAILDRPVHDHDLGFQFFCSAGNGYRLTGDEAYKKMLLRAADSLARLFNPKVGTILSWPNRVKDFNWPHNTIIDNMMNLELLFWASKNGGNKKLYDLAVQHATVTMNNHFRPDFSTYHVAVYDDQTGKLLKGVTHQGFADNSMWARGQAWAIYGYTMTYRETQNPAFLQTAINAANIFLKRLPKDKIPFWDFDDPAIPNAPRDASAATIVASALLELSTFCKDVQLKTEYKNTAIKMLEELSSDRYLSGKKNHAILLHSTGNKPKNKEVDMPIIYADYYYLEALLRWKKMN